MHRRYVLQSWERVRVEIVDEADDIALEAFHQSQVCSALGCHVCAANKDEQIDAHRGR